MPAVHQGELGKKGEAEIVRLYAAVGNTDTNEGNGKNFDHSYYLTVEEAKIGAVGIGAMGEPGKVEPRFAVHFVSDGTYFLTESKIETTNVESKRIQIREKALAKLSNEERIALGFK